MHTLQMKRSGKNGKWKSDQNHETMKMHNNFFFWFYFPKLNTFYTQAKIICYLLRNLCVHNTLQNLCVHNTLQNLCVHDTLWNLCVHNTSVIKKKKQRNKSQSTSLWYVDHSCLFYHLQFRSSSATQYWSRLRLLSTCREILVVMWWF